jgi:hypothetical protein
MRPGDASPVRQRERPKAALEKDAAGDQRAGAMVSFLIELWTAKHADVNLRRFLKWIRKYVPSVLAANRFHFTYWLKFAKNCSRVAEICRPNVMES